MEVYAAVHACRGLLERAHGTIAHGAWQKVHLPMVGTHGTALTNLETALVVTDQTTLPKQHDDSDDHTSLWQASQRAVLLLSKHTLPLTVDLTSASPCSGLFGPFGL